MILGPHWQHLAGPEAVCERIGGVDVFFPPGAFGQNHLELADALVEQIHAWVGDERTRARALRRLRPDRARAPRAQPRGRVQRKSRPRACTASRSVSPRGPRAERARARVIPGEAGAAIDALARCDTVIADPPRQGLDAGLLEALIAQPPERLIYASCDATTFIAQARSLSERSPLRLRELLAFELFPQTRHVETLALFTR